MQQPLLLFLFCLPLCFTAQTSAEEEDYVNDNVLRYDDYSYKPTIKTVQFHVYGWDYGTPIITMNTGEQLELSFDDLDGDNKQYSLTFIHCNADWTPSDLMVSEYLNGYFDLNFVNFSFSLRTFQSYTHYNIVFPQQNLGFTKSGNYLVYVYNTNDKKDLVLSRRMMVVDRKVNIAATFRREIGGGDQYSKQHVDFTITSPGYQLTDPYKDMKVVMTQNNRWDNAVTDIKPTFLHGSQIVYSLDDASTFNGGNEFRYFDARSLRFLTERVANITRDRDMKYHVEIQREELYNTKPYLYHQDVNGDFVIRNTDATVNMDVEADYMYTHFFLPYPVPESKGNFYLMGKLTDWRMNKQSKLTYNYTLLGYETTLYLKQGYYNYIYVLSNDDNKHGDETVTEGNHWDTENDYNIYVYHRKFGTYYDQLLGHVKLNSLKH